MNFIDQQLRVPNRRVWNCAAIVLAAVITVLGWAAIMDGDTDQTASMLGATIAVTAAAASGTRSCRPTFQSRSRRTPGR